MDKSEELRLLGQLLDQGQPLVHQIVPMAAPSAPSVPGIVEMFGKRYQVTPFTKGDGTVAHQVSMEVSTPGGGKTWRTMNRMNKGHQAETKQVLNAYINQGKP